MDEKSLLLVLAIVGVIAVVSLGLYSSSPSGMFVKGTIELSNARHEHVTASARPMSDSCRATQGRCYYSERGPTTYCPYQADGACPGGCSCLYGNVQVVRSSPWWRYNLG